MTKETVHNSQQLIKETECILIGSGAGLSAAAGINYADEEAFAVHFSGWAKKGFTAQYQLLGYQNWTQAEQWGYYTANLRYVYYQQKHNELYQKLRAIIGEKDYFSMTSNVEELFHKNGFDHSKIYTPQGSYGNIQCAEPCTNKVWDTKPFYNKMLKALDPITQVLTNDLAIPKCPNCGGDMFLNVRVDDSFIEKPYEPELQRLQKWLNAIKGKKLLLLELGSGYNTPGVIRMPMEHIKQSFPNASFIRVNMQYAQIPAKIENNSISVQGDINNFITKIFKNE